jgi:uncharacterized protein
MRRTDIAFPYHLDSRGMTARAGGPAHVRQLIEQVLLTSPGERVNRPDFGCGLARLVFAEPRGETLTALQALAHASLQQWLAGVILLQSVDVSMQDSALDVVIVYVDLADQQRYQIRVRP